MRLCLVGCVRDCEPYLQALFSEIENRHHIFDDFRYIFIENDSKDYSGRILERFQAKNPYGKVLRLPSLLETLPGRIARIAHGRQLCLDEARKLGWDRPNDLFLILDCDDVSRGFSLQHVKSIVEGSEFEWDALFANNAGCYYDIFALRHPQWCPEDCFSEMRDKPVFMSDADAYNLYVKARQIVISPKGDPIPVNSAFGGLGIYKFSSLNGSNYSAIGKICDETCEHVWLHEHMRRAGFGKLFIHPELLVHHRHKRLSFPQKLKRSVLKRWRRLKSNLDLT